MKEKLFKRIKAACHTNEPQMTAVFVLTVATLIAYIKTSNVIDSVMVIIICLTWPSIAFCINLVDPIPKN